MTTIKRYTKSQNSSSNNSGNNTAPKGSMNNPYTEEEYKNIPEEQWKGGYVIGMGYVLPYVDVIGSKPSQACSDNFSDSYSYTSSWNFSNMCSTPVPDGEETGGTGEKGEANGDGNTQEPNASESNNGKEGGDKPIGYKEGYRYYFKDGKLQKVLNNTIGYDSISVNGVAYPINGTITPVENADPQYGSQYIATYQIFQILAEHSDVEWAASFNEDGTAYINTTNLHNKVNFLVVTGYTCMVHSHPEGTDLSDPDLSFYAKMLAASLIDKSNQYQKFYLYRNGQLEDKTKDVWDYARTHKKETQYKKYANKDPYK